MLNDTHEAALELTQADPTVNDALYALSQKGSPAEVHVIADNGTQVTMSKGSKVLTAQVSSGEAVLYPAELGDWSIKYTFDGSQKTRTWTLEVIGIVYVYPFEIGATLNDTVGKILNFVAAWVWRKNSSNGGRYKDCKHRRH